MTTQWDNDQITVVTRTRCYGRWGDFELFVMTVEEARELRQRLSGRTFDNTKPGDKVFIKVHGTLSQIYATETN